MTAWTVAERGQETIKEHVQKSPVFDPLKDPVEIKIDVVKEPEVSPGRAALALDYPAERELAA